MSKHGLSASGWDAYHADHADTSGCSCRDNNNTSYYRCSFTEKDIFEKREKLIKSGFSTERVEKLSPEEVLEALHPVHMLKKLSHEEVLKALYPGQWRSVQIGEFFRVHDDPNILLIKAWIPMHLSGESHNALVIIGNDKFKTGSGVYVNSGDFDKVVKIKVIEQ